MKNGRTEHAARAASGRPSSRRDQRREQFFFSVQTFVLFYVFVFTLDWLMLLFASLFVVQECCLRAALLPPRLERDERLLPSSSMGWDIHTHADGQIRVTA